MHALQLVLERHLFRILKYAIVYHRLVDDPRFLHHSQERAARLWWGARGAWGGRAGSTLLAPVAGKL